MTSQACPAETAARHRGGSSASSSPAFPRRKVHVLKLKDRMGFAIRVEQTFNQSRTRRALALNSSCQSLRASVMAMLSVSQESRIQLLVR